MDRTNCSGREQSQCRGGKTMGHPNRNIRSETEWTNTRRRKGYKSCRRLSTRFLPGRKIWTVRDHFRLGDEMKGGKDISDFVYLHTTPLLQDPKRDPEQPDFFFTFIYRPRGMAFCLATFSLIDICEQKNFKHWEW